MAKFLVLLAIVAASGAAEAATARYQAQVIRHADVSCPPGHTAAYPEFINLLPPVELIQDMGASDASAQLFFKDALCRQMFSGALVIHASCVKTETLALPPDRRIVDFMHPSAHVSAARLVRRDDQTNRIEFWVARANSWGRERIPDLQEFDSILRSQLKFLRSYL